jgi:hypothetical protein
MKATVVHDEDGQIIAISQVVDLERAGSKFVRAAIVPSGGQQALGVELNEELASMRLRDIHRHYKVDRATSKLVRREHAITE